MIDKQGNTLLMEAVDTVEPEGDGVKLISIFGEQKFVKGRIHSLALVDHNIFIQPEE
jgi:predicted RNA-binding protein